MSTNKISRHDLKKPDEFVSVTTRAIEWMQDNIKVVAAAVAAVLLVAVGVLAVVQQQRAKADEAFFQYGQAVDEFHKAAEGEDHGEAQAKAIEASLGKLQKVYDEYRGTRAADFALVSIGAANFQLRKYEQAANAYETAIGRFENEPNYKALALVGAGKSWEAMRNIDKALDYYQRANAVPGNPYQQVLENEIGRLKLFKDQMNAMKAAQGAVSAPAQ